MSWATLRLETNVRRSADTDLDQLVDKLAAAMTEEIAKGVVKWDQARKAVSVIIVPTRLMMYAGSRDPCAIVTVTGLGLFGGVDWSVSGRIFHILKDCLGIPGDRCYIRLEDVDEGFVIHSDKDRGGRSVIGSRYREIEERRR